MLHKKHGFESAFDHSVPWPYLLLVAFKMSATECGICFMDYDRKVNRPLIGKCGHTFCSRCSVEFRKKKCPTCRIPSFNSPPTNFALLDKIENEEDMRAEIRLSVLREIEEEMFPSNEDLVPSAPLEQAQEASEEEEHPNGSIYSFVSARSHFHRKPKVFKRIRKFFRRLVNI